MDTIPEWDLQEIYKTIHDPKIESDKKRVIQLAEQFTNVYKGKITLSPDQMLRALHSYEEILEIIYLYNSYASYVHAKDSLSSENGIFFQESQEFVTNIQTKLAWFELSILAIDEEAFNSLLQSTQLQTYRHFFERQRIFKPHTLSEKEETLLSLKGQTSHDAFVRLYDEITVTQTYELNIKDEVKLLSYSEITPFLTSHPDRKIRESAALAITKGLEHNSKLYAFILNALLLDKKTSDEIRHYAYPQQATLLSYEIKKETVEHMVASIEARYQISERYYNLKRKFLQVPALHEWDRYSPVFVEETKEYSWNDAKKIVLDVFGEFSPDFQTIAREFFDKKWIDAKITAGKRDGAFCSYSTPNLHPYVFLNFSGQIRDVETIAHELGHGIHAYLSQKQTLLSCWPSTATAEIASIFCETIVFESLYRKETNRRIKLRMLSDKIQSMFATIFRQNAFYLFESDIHLWRRTKGELAIQDFNKLFQERMQPMFGEGLNLTTGHQYWWMPILHFYHYNFYVFSYAFGQMMSTALYAKYKECGEKFTSSYIEALSMGSSEDPYVITKTMGVDLNASDFWTKGLDIIENYVDEFETLIEM